MRLTDTPEEAAWRSEVRAFLEQQLPADIKRPATAMFAGYEGGAEQLRPAASAGGSGFQPLSGSMALWRDKLAERGWIAPAWPVEYGGAGLTPAQQFILNEEFAEAGAPQMGGMGVSMAGPTIIKHGTPEQKTQHLPPILRGETHWCQGFSEPSSGSDLASLQTRAVRDGDEFVLNGSKIWTSGAQQANWMFMLARTDSEAPKHRGITYFLLDFTSPGITVVPIVNMAGGAGFNQVFFDDVRVPAQNVVGEINRGWYVATTTLDFERSAIGTAVGLTRVVADLIAYSREHAESPQSRLGRVPAVRQELAERYIEARVARMLSNRVVSLQNAGSVPNYEASMAKLFGTELTQRIYRTAMKSIGLYGLTWDRDSPHAPSRAQYPRSYVSAISATIAGGTSEIQRNIIAQRGLGMPRS